MVALTFSSFTVISATARGSVISSLCHWYVSLKEKDYLAARQ